MNMDERFFGEYYSAFDKVGQSASLNSILGDNINRIYCIKENKQTNALNKASNFKYYHSKIDQMENDQAVPPHSFNVRRETVKHVYKPHSYKNHKASFKGTLFHTFSEYCMHKHLNS